MTLECRIPISPTPAFLNRVRLLAASIRRFYPNAIVRCYIGQPGGATPESIQVVSDAFAGQRIGFEWIAAREFDAWEGTRSPFLATMNRRFRTPIDGDYVLILDADVICTGRFDELFEINAVQGVQAHVPPLSENEWKYLFSIAEAPWPDTLYGYSGDGIMQPTGHRAPFYPNSGFVFAPRALFERLITPYNEAVSVIRSAVRDTYWADQWSLSIAIAKSGVPIKPLEQKFNFPNQAEFDRAYPNDLKDIRILHYLRTTVVDRDTDFADLQSIRRFVTRYGLTGSNEILRQHVSALTKIFEPTSLELPQDIPWA